MLTCHFNVRNVRNVRKIAQRRVWVCENVALWERAHFMWLMGFRTVSFSINIPFPLHRESDCGNREPTTGSQTISVGAYLSIRYLSPYNVPFWLSYRSHLLFTSKQAVIVLLSSAAKVSVCALAIVNRMDIISFISIRIRIYVIFFRSLYRGAQNGFQLHAFNSVANGRDRACVEISSLPQKKIDLHSSFMQRKMLVTIAQVKRGHEQWLKENRTHKTTK